MFKSLRERKKKGRRWADVKPLSAADVAGAGSAMLVAGMDAAGAARFVADVARRAHGPTSFTFCKVMCRRGSEKESSLCLVLTPDGILALQSRNSEEAVYFHGWTFIRSFCACGEDEFSGYLLPVAGPPLRDVEFYYRFESPTEQQLFLDTGKALASAFVERAAQRAREAEAAAESNRMRRIVAEQEAAEAARLAAVAEAEAAALAAAPPQLHVSAGAQQPQPEESEAERAAVWELIDDGRALQKRLQSRRTTQRAQSAATSTAVSRTNSSANLATTEEEAVRAIRAQQNAEGTVELVDLTAVLRQASPGRSSRAMSRSGPELSPRFASTETSPRRMSSRPGRSASPGLKNSADEVRSVAAPAISTPHSPSLNRARPVSPFVDVSPTKKSSRPSSMRKSKEHDMEFHAYL